MKPMDARDPIPRATEDELEQRRLQVFRFRQLRMTLMQIATALHVDESTVSRDLKWVRDHNRELFGTRPEFSAEEFTGESYSQYRDIEHQALRESTKAAISAKDKRAWLSLAIVARDRQVSLLEDLGILSRTLGTATSDLPTASQIRKALAQAKFDPNEPAFIHVRPS